MKYKKGDLVVIKDLKIIPNGMTKSTQERYRKQIGKVGRVNDLSEDKNGRYHNISSIQEIHFKWYGVELRKPTKKEKEHYEQSEVENEI